MSATLTPKEPAGHKAAAGRWGHTVLEHKWLLLLAALALRFTLAAVLYLYAWYRDPAEPLHTLTSWLLTPDAEWYHRQALNALARGGDLAQLAAAAGQRFSFLLALIYRFTIPHPLVAAAVNTLAAGAAAVLSFQLASLLGRGRRGSLLLAGLVCLWPPGLAYGAVPLRDSLVLAGVLAALLAFGAIWAYGSQTWRRLVPWCLLLLSSLGLLVLVKPYVAIMILAVFGLFIFYRLLVLVCRRPAALAVAGTLLLALVLAALGFMGSRPAPMANKTAREVVQAESWAGGVKKAAQGLWGRLIFMREGFIRTGGRSLAPEAQRVRRELGLADPARRVFYRDWIKLVSRKRPQGDYLRPIWWQGRLHAAVIWHHPKQTPAMIAWALRDLWFYPLPAAALLPHGPGQGLLAWALSLQSLLGYLLLPGVWWGLWRAWQESRAGWLVLWVLAVGIVMALVTVNLGTLYRLRDMVLLPALLAFSPQPYLWLGRILARLSFGVRQSD